MLPSLNFIVYDYETFGKNTKGAVSQFAAIRANNTFEEQERFNFFCKPSQDVVAEPAACLVTHVTPQIAENKGIPEYEFAHKVNNIFNAEMNTVVVGYNSVSFDDEVSRNMFYRNMIDPYRWSFARGNSRFDVSDLVRLIHALRPDTLNWAYVDDVDANDEVVGKKLSFKLEHLSAANGIVHLNAHDALSDVEALLSLMKMIYDKEPELFCEFFELRSKHVAESIVQRKTFGYTCYKFSKTNYISMMRNMGASAKDKNKYFSWDLRIDPSWFATLSDEKLAEVMSMRFAELEENGYPKHGLHAIKINQIPFVFDSKHLGYSGVADNAKLSEIRSTVKANIEFLDANPDFARRVINLYESRVYDPLPNDTDMNLYCSETGGFFQNYEKEAIRKFESAATWKDKLGVYLEQSSGTRLQKMMFRIIGRNEPSVFDEELMKEWVSYVSQRINGDLPNSLLSYDQFMEELSSEDLLTSFPRGEHEDVYLALEAHGRSLLNLKNNLMVIEM
ncbi:exodeoxyribonuclease I [Vibrio crassostreae]|uniref:exodeoxyribonuclease I n=1 Tax=Vibrio crassostreae TaxID=246167 RepID=UPI001B315EAB|nr:exodeoxyribonuclease I [Vibrio crassostreae]